MRFRVVGVGLVAHGGKNKCYARVGFWLLGCLGISDAQKGPFIRSILEHWRGEDIDGR